MKIISKVLLKAAIAFFALVFILATFAPSQTLGLGMPVAAVELGVLVDYRQELELELESISALM